ncbi:MAG: hypothetical protein LUG95_00140 [Clostridiales bacterium]|nr:hypothetical protein [Clostridiales bacterium]
MNTLSTKNKISTAVAIILTVVIIIPCISIGIEAAAEKITSAAEPRQIDEFEEQYKTLDGDSSLRLIVKSSHDIDPLSAVQIAEGWNNIYCLQFENENDLQKSREILQFSRHR